jgi:hypothetical protein
MKRMHGTAPRPVLDYFEFPFDSVRNISCPEDLRNNRKVFSGHAPITSIIDLPTDENVRDYLLEAEGRRRRVPTQVHKAIRDTLENYPENFSVLHGGVVIVAYDSEIDESKKSLRLLKPSIINGSQTQGVIRDFLKDCEELGKIPPKIHVTFELLVMEDDSLIAETSIARNFQNDVLSISIAGRLGHLDELEQALQRKDPSAKLMKSETQLSDDYLHTERLLQVIAALVPSELWLNQNERDNPNKVYTYSQKTKCLKDFQEIYRKAKDVSDPDNQKYSQLYKFYLDIASDALKLYEKWKAHSSFRGSALHSIKRDKSGNILEVPDGIVMPIIASLSAFVRKGAGGWYIEYPKTFQDEDLIRAAKSAYQEMAGSNPQTMGKSKACYTHLYDITSIHRRLSDKP